jgi:hypothetical protein
MICIQTEEQTPGAKAPYKFDGTYAKAEALAYLEAKETKCLAS